tara:strand:- start:65 stop:1459 length:1395 start_codon:yes stop_codon:yes gene_type:complete
MTSIVLFNNDLRITDNQALITACKIGKIIPVFIYDEELRDYGSASKVWLHYSLKALNSDLGGNLIILNGDTDSNIHKLIDQTKATNIYWNRVYEHKTRNFFSKLRQDLENRNIDCGSYNSSLLTEPSRVLKGDGTFYRVFTPYYKKVLENKFRPVFGKPKLMEYEKTSVKGLKLEDLKLLPENHNWHVKITRNWEISEAGALSALQSFADGGKAGFYKQNRDFPRLNATSKLSAYLHFGQISPNQIVEAVEKHRDSYNSEDIDCFISEVVWREFSYYLLYHFEGLPTENFNTKFDKFTWSHNQTALKRWQQGKTGIPIVDAGMRELYETGYMHNRVRMIVASFLTKNLLVDWRDGLKWFEDCLFDADIASNAASWQWVAGTGADAAPYFRIFNPILQSEKFDKSGEYIRKYVPELRKVPDKYIHDPSKIPPFEAVLIGNLDYPKPLVDLKRSRDVALALYQKIK